jgi:2-haloacid dehalogenase
MPARVTLAFDVYGTLIDPLGVATTLRTYVGDRAPAFAQAWRDKQLEYTFRRALMRDYRDFPTCTRQALEFIDLRLLTNLPADALDALMKQYLRLPAYPDAVAALELLKARKHRVYAFSNGHPEDLKQLLTQAGLTAQLDDIVSVHPVASFKPDPAVYRHFTDSTGSAVYDTWLVSGNPFDVIGAHGAGWHTAWVRRDATAVFDPWGVQPTVTVADLRELADVV